MARSVELQIKAILAAYESNGGNISATARQLGASRTAIRYHLKKHGLTSGKARPLVAGKVKVESIERKKLPTKGKVKRYIFTSAQNNTKVNERVWANLLAFKDHYKAELVVGTYSYNMNSYGELATKRGHAPTGIQKELWYDDRLMPYIEAGDDLNIELCETLQWCGRANILPTAQNPLQGFETYTGQKSGIFPHTKIAMRSVPNNKFEHPKFNYTTGTVTMRNYIAKAAGIKAEHHHGYGGLLVEVNHEGHWWVRQLNADGHGKIYDMNLLADKGKVTSGHRVEAINWGDIHEITLQDWARELSWGKGGLLETLRPKHQFMHDLVDFYARSHHDVKNPHKMFQRHVEGLDSVEAEMQHVANFLKSTLRKWCKTVVVDSNHDNFFLRWLAEADYRKDPLNAEYFLEAQREVYRAIREANDDFNPVEWALRRANCPKDIRFLAEDESYVICSRSNGGIECGMHGHLGANGARGTPTGFAKMGRKANIGHTHSAGIWDGICVAGLWGNMEQGYNKGPSSWSHSLIVTYPNGKRAIITVMNEQWRA